MAFGRIADLTQLEPLGNAQVRRYTAGAAITVGQVVSMSSDGYIDPSVQTGVTAVLGIALNAAAAAGLPVDVVTYGPVNCLLDGTPGNIVYASDTAGNYSETAGTKSFIVGVTESPTVLFVRPQYVALA